MDTKMTDIDGVAAYVANPDGNEPEVKGGVLVIHEVWGLVDHTKSVADRFAAEGYVALAPDLLSGTALDSSLEPELLARAQNPATRDEAQKELRAFMAPMHSPEFGAATIAKLQKAYNWLAALSATHGKVAVVGFCFGGSYAFGLASAEPKLAAVVPFYGHASQDPAELAKIACPILAFYGEDDERLMAELPQLKDAMQTAGVDFRAVTYPDTGHAFFNDTNPSTYRAQPAADAWEQTKAFLLQAVSR